MNRESSRPRAGSPEVLSLLQAARAGSRDAAARLVDLFRPYLLHVAQTRMRPQLRQKEAPSDLVQQTVIEALRDLPACQAEDAPELRLWLRGILLHNLEDLQRKYSDTGKREVSRELPLDDAESRELLADLAVDRGDPPAQVALRQEEREQVVRALAALRQEYREALVLYYFDGLTFDAIGALIGKPRGAAERLVKRALKSFGRHYARGSDKA